MTRRALPFLFFLVLAIRCVAAQAETISITIRGLSFSPAEVHAKVGDTIEWVNKDFVAHTATARGGEWDVVIAPNKSMSLILNSPGTVAYYCRFHPNMKGSITIVPK